MDLDVLGRRLAKRVQGDPLGGRVYACPEAGGRRELFFDFRCSWGPCFDSRMDLRVSAVVAPSDLDRLEIPQGVCVAPVEAFVGAVTSGAECSFSSGADWELPRPPSAHAPLFASVSRKQFRAVVDYMSVADQRKVNWRSVLSCVLFDRTHAWCTDSYRLVRWPWSSSSQGVLPSFPFALFDRLLGGRGDGVVEVYYDSAAPALSIVDPASALRVDAAWSPEDYPDVRALWDKSADGSAERSLWWTLPSSEMFIKALLSAGRQMGGDIVIFQSDGPPVLRRESGLEIVIHAGASPVKAAEDAWFSRQYLVAALRHAGKGAVELDGGVSPTMPFFVEGVDAGGAKTLLMPVRAGGRVCD